MTIAEDILEYEENMESQTDKVCFEKFRIKTFANSVFERNRKNCTAKKVNEEDSSLQGLTIITN